jgi:hemerythrin-like domain-containing protein
VLRHPSLIPLSRQHHNCLALCVLGRREGLAKAVRVAIEYYDVELVNHFEIEEQVLFPVAGQVPIIAELVADHRNLEGMIARLRVAPSQELLEEFYTLLTAHVRREERELFEELQRTLPPELLDRTGGEIERRAVRVCGSMPDTR